MCPAPRGGGVKAWGMVLILLTLSLSASLLVAGCGEEAGAPKAALQKFLDAEAAGDSIASYELLSGADKKVIDLPAWTRETGQGVKEEVSKSVHVIVSEAALTDDGATVDVLVGHEGDTSKARDLRFLMVEEGGAWKVSFLKTLAGPTRTVETGGGINWSRVAFGSGTESVARSIIYLVMFLAVYAFYGIGLQRIARVKKLKHPWFAWVPVLNVYIAWRIVGKGVVSTILTLLPVVGIIMYIVWCFKVAKACGRSRWYGLLQVVPVVNLVVFWLLVLAAEDAPEEPAPQPMPA